MEIQTLDKGVVLRFQIVAAIVIAGAAFALAHFGGHYLHEDYAHKIQTGDRAKTSEADHLAALELAKGYRDTQAFKAMEPNLSGTEVAAATVVPHPAEKWAPVAGILAAVIGFFASHEAARVHARKRMAQRSIGRATQRFQKPGG